MTDNLPNTTTEPHTKQDKFIAALFTTPTIKEAANIAGYSQSSRTSFVYDLVKRPEFAAKLREYAIANDLQTLPIIAQIEDRCIQVVAENPEKYPKFKEIFRQKKQIAGILAQDTQPTQPTVNIRTIESLQIVVGESVVKRLKAPK